jgi:hypothetical protein
MTKAQQARAAMNEIWRSPAECSHVHAKRVYALLDQIEADEIRHRAFTLNVAKLVRNDCAAGCERRCTVVDLAKLLDAEIAGMVK